MIPREILKKIRRIKVRLTRTACAVMKLNVIHRFTPRAFAVLSAILAPLFLCSCASEHLTSLQYPADTSINKGACCGDWLLVNLRLESGEELPFIVDTGCPQTILDKSLESKLGKQLGTSTVRYAWYGKRKGKLFNAPKLFLGDTQLLTGKHVKTDNLQPFAHGAVGILGVDCLRHYCVQFDFTARKMRFLNSDFSTNEDPGKAYPLTIFFGCVFTRAEFSGLGKAYFRPDTGCISTIDAILKPKLFQRELHKQTPLFRTQTTTPEGKVSAAWFAKGALDRDVYTNLMVVEWKGVWPSQNLIGLQLLARNLVTFDFPNRVMYLKQQSTEPLSPGYFPNIEAKNFLVELEKKGRLPGLTNETQGELSVSKLNKFEAYPFSLTLDFKKKDHISAYHYSLVQESEGELWKLQRAWQTDAKGKTIEEFPVP